MTSTPIKLHLVVLLALACAGCSFVVDPEDYQGGEVDAAVDPGADAEPGESPVCSSRCDACGAGDCCEPVCSGDCDFECRDGCACAIDCNHTDGTCKATCKDQGTECSIDCTGSNNCDKLKCQDGARCMVRCAGANNCEFEKCDGGETTCPGHVIVCNRSCP